LAFGVALGGGVTWVKSFVNVDVESVMSRAAVWWEHAARIIGRV